MGFLIGWNVPLVWLLVTRSSRRMSELGTYWWVAGFAVGIVVAKLVRPRSDGGGSEAGLDEAAEALSIKGYQRGLTADQLADRLRAVFPPIPEQS